MHSISKPMKGIGSGEYYLELAEQDYYSKDGQNAGRWFGTGMRLLNLPAMVQPEVFRRMLNGYSADGHHAFVQNAGSPSRQTGWDCTFSAPKPVSVLWSQSPPHIQKEIEQAHRIAVEFALKFIEEAAGVSRRGKGGKVHERAALTFATFQHDASRALDPQIHTHCVLINLGIRADGSTGTLHSKDIFERKMEAGALYQVELASQLRARLNVKIESEKVGFHIGGVPRELCREFSKRRRHIEVVMEKRGVKDAVAAKTAALETRPKKQNVGREELMATWLEVGRRFGWSTAQAVELITGGPSKIKEGASFEQLLEKEFAKPNSEKEKETSKPVPNIQKQQSSHTHQTANIPGENKCTSSQKPDDAREAKQNTTDKKTHSDQDRETDSQQQYQSSRAEESFSKNDFGSKREQSEHKRAKHHFFRTGRKVAEENGFDGQTFREGMSKSSTGQKFRLFHIEWRIVFPHAPDWSPANNFRLPVIAVNFWRKPQYWGKVLWSQQTALGEIRLQQKRLFPHAPWWSPARKLSLPALRLRTVEDQNYAKSVSANKTQDQSQHSR